MATFITKKVLARRTFLRGAGATIALPLLESMLPAMSVAKAAEVTPTRFTGIFIPHGAAPGWWVPKSSAPNFEFPYIFKPLEPFRSHVVLTSGMWSQSSENPPGVTGADHFVAAAFLCGVKPKKTTGADIQAGSTIDQVIARHIGQGNLLPSLQLAVEDPGANASNCGEGYSCVYTNTISWETPTRPLPMQINPQVVFERLFGDGGTATERAARREQQRSILDSVMGSLSSIERQVGGMDRVRIDQYLEDVREIERRLQIAVQASTATPAISMPYGVPESFDDHIKLQFDLLALAFQGDITRVGTLLYARDLTGRVYPKSGTDISFHGGSHHAEDPGRIRVYAQLNQYHVKTLAYFVNKLKSIPDGDGTLLDHSVTLYGSNMGDSNQHLHYDVPHVLIGGASGAMKGNRHLAFPSRTIPTGNLLLSILDKFDIHQDSFGDSTGRIEEL
jgi:Protein of unknown function (DUF1552)